MNKTWGKQDSHFPSGNLKTSAKEYNQLINGIEFHFLGLLNGGAEVAVIMTTFYTKMTGEKIILSGLRSKGNTNRILTQPKLWVGPFE